MKKSKAARKKGSAKKSSSKKKRKKAEKCDYTIRLSQTSVTPKVLSIGSGETVRWKNTGTEQRKITFKGRWPFVGAKRSFIVRPGKQTKCFKVRAGESLSKRKYSIMPPLGPPDGPAVDIDS